EVKPIIPIFSYKDWREGSKVYIFGGLLGYKSDSNKKTFKFLFIPINVSSKDRLDAKGGEKR
ncbi:MAG: hypothetical protein ACREOB_00505, partial [Thermodesulfobacteriota bacterium]